MHDAAVNLTRLVPAPLSDSDRRSLIRFGVAKGHAECIANRGEPLRSAVLWRDRATGTYGLASMHTLEPSAASRRRPALTKPARKRE
ncbi:MAG: hypothetical protein DWI03_08680 [Planctomycetota bacterium]|nr:MAG: hypothetical protein DWI03_08680 [Planctomycetota bacterium]